MKKYEIYVEKAENHLTSGITLGVEKSIAYAILALVALLTEKEKMK